MVSSDICHNSRTERSEHCRCLQTAEVTASLEESLGDLYGLRWCFQCVIVHYALKKKQRNVASMETNRCPVLTATERSVSCSSPTSLEVLPVVFVLTEVKLQLLEKAQSLG